MNKNRILILKALAYSHFRRGFKTGPTDSRLLPELEVDDESGTFERNCQILKSTFQFFTFLFLLLKHAQIFIKIVILFLSRANSIKTLGIKFQSVPFRYTFINIMTKRMN
jgi:hypothetical protein